MLIIGRFLLVLVAVGALFGLFAGPAEAADTDITIGSGPFGANPWFCSSMYSGGGVCPTTISQGDSVTWHFPSTCPPYTCTHTTTECGGMSCTDAPPATPVWDSGVGTPNGTYMYTFNTPGVFKYECNIHGSEAMGGQITVLAAVGGVTELSPGDQSPAATTDASARNVGAIMAIAAGAALGTLALGWSARFAARRWRS